MLLLTKEEWVADNVALKITREQSFDVASSGNLADCQVWQTFPLREWVCGHEVSVLVDTSALIFHWIDISGSFFIITSGSIISISSFSCCLNDVVVARGTS